jgi:hypothetical protein
MGFASFHEDIQDLRDELCSSFKRAAAELRVSDPAAIEKIVNRIVEQAFNPHLYLLEILSDPNAELAKDLMIAQKQNRELLVNNQDLAIRSRRLDKELRETQRCIEKLMAQNLTHSDSNRKLAAKLRDAREAMRIMTNKDRHQSEESIVAGLGRLFGGNTRVTK